MEFQEILQEFLNKMDYGDEVRIMKRDAIGETIFEINIKDAKYLIGEKGSNLASLEFLIKLICQKQNIDVGKIFIDINDYRKERIRILKEIAKTAAQKAALTGQTVFLPPMQAFDRKIIHTELSINPNITTESEGLSEERRVVIKPLLLNSC